MVKRTVLPSGFVGPCIPILTPKPPTSAGWVHEIKHDGYRLVRRDGARVRLFTRRGYDWTERFSVIAAAAAALRAKSFTIDGEAVVTGPDGVAAFDELQKPPAAWREAFLRAFDLLEHNGCVKTLTLFGNVEFPPFLQK